MSKKYFVEFARHIRELVNCGQRVQAQACYDMIVACYDNPRFDRSRFYTACGFDNKVALALAKAA